MSGPLHLVEPARIDGALGPFKGLGSLIVSLSSDRINED